MPKKEADGASGKKDKEKEKEKEKPKPVSPLTAPELREYKTLLIDRKRQMIGDVNNMGNEALKKGSDAGDLSSLPLHIADQGTDSFEQEMTLGLMENESNELELIEEALERIADHTFGICETCSKAIPKTRLTAIPYTRQCVECKRKEDGD